MLCRLRNVAFALALLGIFATGCGGGRSSASRAPQSQPGDLALDYITAETYPSLKVEIDFIQGFGPSLEAIDRCRSIWEKRLRKPGGIDFVIDTEIPASQQKARWEIGDILALEAQYRGNYTGDANNRNTATIWMVYLNGASEFDEGTTRALGVAYGGSEIAVFRENLDRTTFPTTRDVVEGMVLVHEGGHLFGLVNNGLPMVNPHEDPANPRHCVFDTCVMFHQIETGDVTRLLTNPPIDYDLQCQTDLYAAGGNPPDATASGEPTPLSLPQPGTRTTGHGPIPDLARIPAGLR
jgi:hypothetical protein